MANEMQYRFNESSYVGQASNGTWVRVDEDEFAESVQYAVKERGIVDHDDTPNGPYSAAYQEEKEKLLDADEWVELIGVNDNVTEA